MKVTAAATLSFRITDSSLLDVSGLETMAWTDHLIPRGRWLTGTSVFPHSRAAARWIAAFFTTTFIFFFVVRSYHQNGIASLLAGGKAGTALPIGSSSGNQQQLGSGTITRLPAWIDTPPAFDVSQVHGGYKAPASPPAVPTGLPPRLAEAAARFLARPALSHEQARAQNEAECPRAQLDEQVNGDQLRSDREGWLAVDAEKVADMRMAAVRFLAARAGEEGEGALLGPGLLGAGGGKAAAVEKGSRGVVIAAGNKRTVERAVVCVRELQKLGWKGAVEVWHFEGELTDEKDREKLKALGVGIHVVSGLMSFGPDVDMLLGCASMWGCLLTIATGLGQEDARAVEELRAQGRGDPAQLVRRGALPGL